MLFFPLRPRRLRASERTLAAIDEMTATARKRQFALPPRRPLQPDRTVALPTVVASQHLSRGALSPPPR